MGGSFEWSHNLPSIAQQVRVSILARALVHGWRHMGEAHMLVEGVAVALVVGLDSSGSPSVLSVPRAHSSHPARLSRALWTLRSPRLYRLYNLTLLVG